MSRIETMTFKLEIDGTEKPVSYRVTANGVEVTSGWCDEMRQARREALLSLRDEWLGDIDDSMTRGWKKEE